MLMRKAPTLGCFCVLAFIGCTRQVAVAAPRTLSIGQNRVSLNRKRPPAIPSSRKSATAASNDNPAALSGHVFNLVKSIVGTGVLGLPAGIAVAFGHSLTQTTSNLSPGVVLITALGLLWIMACLSAFGFRTIGKVCGLTQARSYREAWESTVGPSTGWMPALACLLVTTCSVLTYSMVLADTVPAIWKALLGSAISAPSRTSSLLGVTLGVLMPLCLRRNLASLAPVSLLGILGMVYTATVMAYRWISGAYSPSPAIEFAANAAAAHGTTDAFRDWLSLVCNPKLFVFVSMLSTAMMSHYLSPTFYWALDGDLDRFTQLTSSSFAIAATIMSVIAISGFASFGRKTQSLILNNYPVTDNLLSVSRAAVVLSLIGSYPLAFTGVRNGVFELLGITGGGAKDADADAVRERWFVPLTLGLLLIITGLAWVLPDIGVILALGGSTWGNCVIYLFPALMLYRHAATASPEDSSGKVKLQASILGLVGLVAGITGTVQAFS